MIKNLHECVAFALGHATVVKRDTQCLTSRCPLNGNHSINQNWIHKNTHGDGVRKSKLESESLSPCPSCKKIMPPWLLSPFASYMGVPPTRQVCARQLELALSIEEIPVMHFCMMPPIDHRANTWSMYSIYYQVIVGMKSINLLGEPICMEMKKLSHLWTDKHTKNSRSLLFCNPLQL